MANARLFTTDHSASWPQSLRQAAANQALDMTSWEPKLIRMDGPDAVAALDELLATHAVAGVLDSYEDQIADLVISRSPQLYRADATAKREAAVDFMKSHLGDKKNWQAGSWAYYPWSGQLVHVIEEELFQELRTCRNREIMSKTEQHQFSEYRVGCVGMSVGSNAAVALVLQGGSNQLKISDGAAISGSNLNRIRTGVSSVGIDKAVVISRQLFEMNPYLELDKFDGALNQETLPAFFDKPWPLDVVIDEMDNLEMKIRLRVEARRRRLPVLMATDLGDDVMLDVERFDLDPNLPLFHGIAGVIEDVLSRPNMTQLEWLKYATLIIGTKNVPLRMQQSLLKVGSELVTQPQLGGTAMMAGSVLAYAVRALATGGALKSGRTTISLDAALVPDHNSAQNREAHAKHTELLEQTMNSDTR